MPKLTKATKEKIIEQIENASLQLFTRQGYHGTSMREIAEKVGLTPGALYNHFQSKEELFSFLVARYKERLFEGENAVKKVLEESQFPDDLADLGAAIQEVVQKHKSFWLLWYVDVLEFGGKHFKSTLAPQFLLDSPGLKSRLEKLGEQKILRTDPNFAFIMIYMSLFNYYIVEIIFGGKNHYNLPMEEALEKIIDIFLNGILAPETKEEK